MPRVALAPTNATTSASSVAFDSSQKLAHALGEFFDAAAFGARRRSKTRAVHSLS
jgi:hypothetical protein